MNHFLLVALPPTFPTTLTFCYGCFATNSPNNSDFLLWSTCTLSEILSSLIIFVNWGMRISKLCTLVFTCYVLMLLVYLGYLWMTLLSNGDHGWIRISNKIKISVLQIVTEINWYRVFWVRQVQICPFFLSQTDLSLCFSHTLVHNYCQTCSDCVIQITVYNIFGDSSCSNAARCWVTCHTWPVTNLNILLWSRSDPEIAVLFHPYWWHCV